MNKDFEKRIKAAERASEIADIESMHGTEMAQCIEMNEEIEEKIVLIKRLQSKLKFFRGFELAEVILFIIILLYSSGILIRRRKFQQRFFQLKRMFQTSMIYIFVPISQSFLWRECRYIRQRIYYPVLILIL